jgi:hypothetical protein
VSRRWMILISLATCCAAVFPTVAHAAFTFNPGSLSAVAEGQSGLLETQAGAHPFAYTVQFSFPEANEQVVGGNPRDIIVELPAGLSGNPLAVPRCTRQQYEGALPKCPANTVVGKVEAIVPEGAIGGVKLPVFNMEAPPGSAAQFGAAAVNLNILQNASVNTEGGYRVTVGAFNIPNAVSSVKETIWGIPAESSHDLERGGEALDNGIPATSDAPRLPFVTLPTSCEEPLPINVKADSKLAPGVFVEQAAISTDTAGNPLALTGCESVPFSPGVSSAPTTNASEEPSGLNFQMKLPNQGLMNPSGITETEPEKTEVTLPLGITANPSAATGLGGCTLQQYRETTAEAVPGQGCPGNSKIGTLVARTPLLEEEIEGSVYLATPHANPFNSLLALYIVARAPERGVLIKQAGNVHADPTTGQLTTVVDGLPPLPYSSFELQLREGPRAPLITPQACGTYETVAKLYPFSAPSSATVVSAPFKVTEGTNGSGCAASESEMRNSPKLEAGTTVPVAGAYSPFIFRVARADGEQRFSSLQATLPAGLVGKLAGIPYCSESDIAIAMSRGEEGGGELEKRSPSCPAASQVGTVDVAAGAGPQPYHAQGKVYLAGPYKGGPFSLEVITPAVAGPFDLGSVAVRTALSVDPFTAQIHAESGPLPSVLHGIPLDVRNVTLQMSRPEFMLNPTNCSAKTLTASITALSGSTTSLSNPFAVGGCKGLELKPKLTLSLKGQTKRAGHPALKAVLTYPQGSGYSNIARAQVGLPHSEFLDQGNIRTVCKQADLRSGTCPKASIYGKAKAWTPLLDKPLTGPVYLGVGFGHKLPDLVVELNGQIRALVHGKVDTDRQQGIRNTFEGVPDAPVTRFVLEMQGGKKGLLENSTNICRGSYKAEVKFSGQNGKVVAFKAPIAASCGKKKKK